MPRDWEDRGRYARGGQDYERGGRGYSRGERDWTDRAGDEMRSWFGDDDAERRRMEDERRTGSRDHERSYRGGWSDDDHRERRYAGGYGDRGGPYAGHDRPDYDRPGAYGGYGRESVGGGQYGRGSYSADRYGVAGYGMAMAGGSPYEYSRDYRGGRGHGSQERGFFERAGDEVASWFGDEDAERRRERDARHRGRGPRNYTRSDERIREDVNDRLADDPHIDASDIDVSVSSGEVTLDGTVNERFAKRHAEDIAERVSGVKHVQNNLRVSEQQAASDVTGRTNSGLGLTGQSETSSAGSRH